LPGGIGRLDEIVPPIEMKQLGKIVAQHSERNKDPILKVLQQYVKSDTKGNVFEVASGTGQHVLYFADHFPNLQFFPSDITDECIYSINEYAIESKYHNVHQAQKFDIRDPYEGKVDFQFIININMIHISEWLTCQNLMKFAGSHLTVGGYLFMYGPYMVDGQHNAPSNEEFDRSLKGRNSLWGLRDISEVEAEAKQSNLKLMEKVVMPSNNFTLVFQKIQ
jgi:hypothetical protein